jgi:YHS domain-containing protein
MISRGRPISALILARSKFALPRRTGKKEEALGLRRLLHSLIVASVAAVVALSANNAVLLAQNAGAGKGSDTAKVNANSKGIILKGYDVVAFFKQGKPVKGNPAIESTYQNVTYLFASAADKADFDKESPKYVPQYGGFCAYGVANGVLADIESPDAFTVYKGKLYFCGDQTALKSFNSNIDSNIEKADANWRQLTGS